MNPSFLPAITAHIWQSTWCVGAAWLLTLALRRNRAAVRYWVWLAASVKFLIPFALLVLAGSQAGKSLMRSQSPAPLREEVSFVVTEVAVPLGLAAPDPSLPTPFPATPGIPPSNWFATTLLGIWGCGVIVGILYWMRSWQQLRATRRTAVPLRLDVGIEVKSSPSRVEPGVTGIWRPVLLLPDGITDRLTPGQFQAVIAHELCHVRRRDNLTASIHMVVETVFWFHPLVWWIRTRLVEERERACDEEVLRRGNTPSAYAEGIIEVCKHYVESPMICVAGISGANLRKRIETIMENHFMVNLGYGKKLMIGAVATVAVAAPVTVGIIGAPSGHTQPARPVATATPAPIPVPAMVTTLPQPALTAAAVVPPPAFPAPVAQVLPVPPRFTTASISLAQPSAGHQPAYRIGPDSVTIQVTKFTDLIQKAWPVRWYQIVWPAAWSAGGPDWSVGGQARYDVSATMPATTSPQQLQLMLQALFADRLKLAAHWEVRTLPVYALRIAPGGIKFQAAADPSAPQARMDIGTSEMEFKPRFPRDPVPGPSGMTINNLTEWFSSRYDLRMVDLTGLNGVYDIDLTIARDPNTPAQLNLNAPWPIQQGFFDAMESQLGLRVDRETLPVQMLVIDNLQREPTAVP